MKHPDKKNEMPLRDYSWIIFLPFVALGWMAVNPRWLRDRMDGV